MNTTKRTRRDEVREALSDVDAKIAALNAQIRDAKSRAYTHREFLPANEFAALEERKLKLTQAKTRYQAEACQLRRQDASNQDRFTALCDVIVERFGKPALLALYSEMEAKLAAKKEPSP